ncbi:tail tape-measure protein [Myroides odoratimimus]|nr:tail tape-measure protein [Myroides odoratimimus]
MQRLGGAAVETTNRLGTVQHESVLVASALRELGAPADKLKEQLDKLKQERGLIHQRDVAHIRQFNTEIQNLERQIQSLESTTSQSKLSSWAKDAFSQIPFAGLLTNPLVVAGTIAGASIKKGIEQDLQNTSFEVLLGSKEAAQNMVANLTKYGMETPYDKMSLGENAKQLLGFQIEGQKVMPILRAIGDLAMGDKNKMDSLTLAFAQMSSTGKLNGQDLNQMINAGFNPLSEMALKTGKSIGQLKDEMAKGSISAQMVEDAFMSATAEGGKFYQMAEKQGQTLGGKWAQFVDNASEKLLIFYQVIGPVAEKLIELGGAVLDLTFNGLGWLVNQIQEGNPYLLFFAIAIGSITLALMIMKGTMLATTAIQKGMTLATNLGSAAWWKLNFAMLSNPITWIIAGVIALIALIGWLIYKVDGWGLAWSNTVNAAKSLWSGYINLIKFTWGTIYDMLMRNIENIMVAWYKLKSLWNEDEANAQIAIIEQRSEERKAALKQTAQEAKQDFANAWDSTKKAAGSLKWNDKSLSDMMGDMKKSLGISSPDGVPGASTINSSIGGGKGDKDKSNTAVATGGTKHNYITINLNDLIGVLNINREGFKESVDEMQEQSTDAFLRLLGSAVSAGN